MTIPVLLSRHHRHAVNIDFTTYEYKNQAESACEEAIIFSLELRKQTRKQHSRLLVRCEVNDFLLLFNFFINLNLNLNLLD